MKAEELMVGDWVNHTDKADETIKERITAWGIKCIHEDESFAKRFNPIPITPEILEKNGFVEHPGYPRFYLHKYKNDEDKLLMTFAFIKNGDGMILNVWGEESSFSSEKKKIYLHELQHAIRMCHIDKEIEP